MPGSYKAPANSQETALSLPRQDVPSTSRPRPNSGISSSPDTSRLASSRESVQSFETKASSIVTSNTLFPLPAKNVIAEGDDLEALIEDDPTSFDLVLPMPEESRAFQLEDRSEQMFSREHLQEIFSDSKLLLQFANFLSSKRPKSIQLLVYYFDALKALRAIAYADAVAEALTPIEGYDFSGQPVRPTMNSILEEKAKKAFDALVRDDLPAFITHTFTRVVSLSIQRRITGTLPPHLCEGYEGLAEVFCLTDPSKHDNPIVFASEGIQYASHNEYL
jgi:hypothetical protein